MALATSRPRLPSTRILLTCAAALVFAACGDETAGTERSFYLQKVGPWGLRVPHMTPTALCPVPCEPTERCPKNCRVILAGPASSGLIGEYLSALRLEREGLPRNANGKLEEFRQVLARVLDEFSGHVDADPGGKLFALIKHYPHPTAGRDYQVIHTSFYTVADPYLTLDRVESEMGAEARMSGSLLEVRMTYHVANDRATPIEAMIEVSDDVRRRGHRRGLPAVYAGPEIPTTLRGDGFWGGHFEEYGAGVRVGLYWCDRSLGRGAAKPWACAYRLAPLGLGRPALEPLADEACAWLLDISNSV